MSFTLNWPTFSDIFISSARDHLAEALNKGAKPRIIADYIHVIHLDMGSRPPELEIMEVGDLHEDRFRGIFKLTYKGDACLTLQTKVQVNPVPLFSSDPTPHSNTCAPECVKMSKTGSSASVDGVPDDEEQASDPSSQPKSQSTSTTSIGDENTADQPMHEHPLASRTFLHSTSMGPLFNAAPLAADWPLVVPMHLHISNIRLNGIIRLVVDKAKGVTLVFKNDPLESILISSTFDDVPAIRQIIQRQIEAQLRNTFQHDLPIMIHKMSRFYMDFQSGTSSLSTKMSQPTMDNLSTNSNNTNSNSTSNLLSTPNQNANLNSSQSHTPILNQNGYSSQIFVNTTPNMQQQQQQQQQLDPEFAINPFEGFESHDGDHSSNIHFNFDPLVETTESELESPSNAGFTAPGTDIFEGGHSPYVYRGESTVDSPLNDAATVCSEPAGTMDGFGYPPLNCTSSKGYFDISRATLNPRPVNASGDPVYNNYASDEQASPSHIASTQNPIAEANDKLWAQIGVYSTENPLMPSRASDLHSTTNTVSIKIKNPFVNRNKNLMADSKRSRMAAHLESLLTSGQTLAVDAPMKSLEYFNTMYQKGSTSS